MKPVYDHRAQNGSFLPLMKEKPGFHLHLAQVTFVKLVKLVFGLQSDT